MNKLFTTAALVCALSLGFTSCSKDDDKVEQVEPEYQAKVMVKDGETVDLTKVSKTINTQGTVKRTGKTYSLRNFRQFTIGEDGKATTTAAETYYFDFKENDATLAADAPLILVAKQRVMDINANVLKSFNLSYIDKPFDQVSSTDQFISISDNKAGISMSTSVIGWASYNLITHHVIAVKDRTFILLKEGKPYFKFKVNSVYSDEKPNKEIASDNYVFYSIDYQEFK